MYVCQIDYPYASVNLYSRLATSFYNFKYSYLALHGKLN